MSSPIHRANNVDAASSYAPPWVGARNGARDSVYDLMAQSTPSPTKRHRAIAADMFSGDVAILELQRQLALDPDMIPELPSKAVPALWPGLLRLSAVGAVAGLVAWGMMLLPNIRRHEAIVPPGALAAQDAVKSAKAVPVQFASAAPQLVPEQTAVPQLASEKFVGATVPAPPAAAAPPPPLSSPVMMTSPTDQGTLDGQEIATLVKRGKDFLTDGDLASARLLLQRAAEAGSAEGALALGASFDPLVMRQLGAIGAAPDIASARKWYQRAAELGSTAASQQLEKLAQVITDHS